MNEWKYPKVVNWRKSICNYFDNRLTALILFKAKIPNIFEDLWLFCCIWSYKLFCFWLFIRLIKLCDFLNIYITSAVSKRLGGWGWSRGNVELMNLIYFHVFIDRTVWPVWSGEMTECCCSESGLACSRCGKSSPGRLPAIGCDWVKIQTGPSQSADLRLPFLLWASSAAIYQNAPEIKGRPRRWWLFWEYKCLLPYNYFHF